MITASVIGRQFDLTALERLVDEISSEQVLDALDEALAADIIEECPEAFGKYQFTHVLIQETLASELSSSRRTRLHARIAETLEELWGDDRFSHAAELAAHFARSKTILGPEKVASYSLVAGEQALATYAQEEALHPFERGLTAKSGQPMDTETAALLFGLGRAQGASDQVQQAWENFRRAFDYYVATGDVERVVQVASYPLFFVPGITQATRMATQALKLVPPDTPEAGRLLCRYGQLLNLEAADCQGAQEALLQALAIARQTADVALEMQVLTNMADVHWYHLNWPEVAACGVQAVERAHRLGESNPWALYLTATGLWILGRPGEASRHAADMLQQAERLHNRGLLANALLQNGIIHHIRGDWQTARTFYERGLDVAPTWYLMLGLIAQLEYEAGNFDVGQSYLDRLIEVVLATPVGPTGERFYAAFLPSFAACITGTTSHLDVIQEAEKILLASPSITPLVGLDARHGLALMAVYQGDRAAAQTQYDTLKSTAGILLPDLMAADRMLGLLARTMGEVEIAMSHFDQALAFCRAAGYQPEVAWTCHAYADALLTRCNHDDRQRALSLIAEGVTLARELQMHPVLERLLHLQKQGESQDTPSTYPAGLTERQVEVMRLMAAGKTNRDIAATLFISPHTVNYHVKNIFFKIGASNRAEASAFAIRHGLA